MVIGYLKLHHILKGRNIVGVYVQYPLRNLEPLKRMLSSAEDFENMIFVDNQQSFKEALDPMRYNEFFTDRGDGDLGHCTAKGNHLIASNIARAVLGILE